MSPDKAEVYLDSIFNKYFNEQEEFDKIYLSKEDIDELKKVGMEIGLHGHNHLYLGKISFEEALKDLTKSVKIFKYNFPTEILIISYPFGDYNLFTKRIVKKLGCMILPALKCGVSCYEALCYSVSVRS